MPNSNVLLDVGIHGIDAELQLPMADLALAMHLPPDVEPGAVATKYGELVKRYLLEHVQARTESGHGYSLILDELHYERINDNDWLIARLHLLPPADERSDSLILDYDVISHAVVNHNTLLSIRNDFRHGHVNSEATPVVLLGYQLTHFKLDLGGGSWWQGFTSIFSLGMRHIAEGTDHVLFLLTLLLPAPLLASAGRWRQTRSVKDSLWNIVRIVSGFTLGHSITLALGALGLVAVSSRLIEVLIGFSIFVSALHALRPLFNNKELYLAAGFGLVHGLAFASTLSGLGYDFTVLVSSIMGFNLGIEAMQLAIVIAVLPWLLLLSRTACYDTVRWLAALFAAAAALGWMGERTFGFSNPMSAVVEAIAAHAFLSVALLASAALLTTAISRFSPTLQAGVVPTRQI